jgi:uncharacterized protein (TIGR04141 family)
MASPDGPKKLKLTVFLIKDGYKEIEDFLSFDGLHVVPAEKDGKEIGTLVYRGGFQSKPPWVSIFEGFPGFDSAQIFNQSSKAVYVVRHEGRWFCFTFGYARHLIDDLAYERNFGLIVTLNLGDPEAIKSIDKTHISHVSLQSREQAARELELGNFEFDNDIDLLKSVTAKSRVVEGEDQETLSGRDSVTIYTSVTVDAFSEIANRLYEAFRSTKYEKNYPWLGKIREERDSEVIDALDSTLVSKIAKKDLHKIWLAIPELVEWEQIRGFAYKRTAEGPMKAGPVLYQDLGIDEWCKVARTDSEISAKQLKSKKVFIYWQDGRDPSSWSLYRCLNAEIDLNHKKYILNDGDWYQIEPGYVKEVSDFYDSVPSSKVKLPPYGSNTEPAYLKTIAAGSAGYALMDRRVVMIGGGRSRVEFCDLYSKAKKEIIHVKKYGGASLLSHLFSQALVAGECFLHEADFRTRLNDLLPPGFKLTNPMAQPIANEYEVCIAIMSKEKGGLELPFFSKVSFKHAVKALRNLGYKVTKLKIER